MTAAAVAERAMGRKSADLITLSIFTLSTSTAMVRPIPTVSMVPTTNQSTLFLKIERLAGSVKNLVFHFGPAKPVTLPNVSVFSKLVMIVWIMGQMKKSPINTMVGAIHKKADQVKSRLLRGGTATETRSCWAIVAIHVLLCQNKACAGSTAYVDYRVKQLPSNQESEAYISY